MLQRLPELVRPNLCKTAMFDGYCGIAALHCDCPKWVVFFFSFPWWRCPVKRTVLASSQRNRALHTRHFWVRIGVIMIGSPPICHRIASKRTALTLTVWFFAALRRSSLHIFFSLSFGTKLQLWYGRSRLTALPAIGTQGNPILEMLRTRSKWCVVPKY